MVWDICLRKDNIWVKWVHSYFIRNDSLWEMSYRSHLSWQLKRILTLRAEAMKCIELGEGYSIRWKTEEHQFKVKGSYDILNGYQEVHQWADSVWTKISAPKHSFCSWLAVQDRLRTRDKLPWMSGLERNCCWCTDHEETNAHIFFHCSNMQVIKPLLLILGKIFNGLSWDDFFQWRSSTPWRSGNEKALGSFLVNAAVFEVWKARNHLIFRGKIRSCQSIVDEIWKMTKRKIHAIEHIAKWSNLKMYCRMSPREN